MKTKFSMKTVGVIAVLVLGAGLVSFSAIDVCAAEKAIKWRCQAHLPASSPSYKASLLVIIEKLKKRTNGNFIIEPYPAGSLVPAKEIFNATKRGMIQMGMMAIGYFQNQIPLAGVSGGLPFAFKEVWEAIYFIKFKGYEQELKDACLKYDLYFYFDRVNPHELALRKPVRTFDDFKGLKLRSFGVLQKFLTSIGAAASYLPGPEIYPALASGVVDGAHWAAAQGANDMAFYEVCKYHLKPALAITATDGYLINKKAFDSLPAEYQRILNEIITEHFFLRSTQYQYGEKVTLAKVQKEKGVTVYTLSPEDQKKMTKAAMKIWDKESEKDPEYAKVIQKIKEFQKELGYF